MIRPANKQQALFFLALSFTLVIGCGDGSDIETNPPTAMPPDTTSDVVINEVFLAASQIELYNRGMFTADMSLFALCHTTPGTIYFHMPEDTMIESGDFLVVHWGIAGVNTNHDIFTAPTTPLPLNQSDGEIGLFEMVASSELGFGESKHIHDYVQWGKGGHFREHVAVEARIWPVGEFAITPNPGQSLSYSGTGDSPDAWSPTTPTTGFSNILAQTSSTAGT